jgi:hypothetical protein
MEGSCIRTICGNTLAFSLKEREIPRYTAFKTGSVWADIRTQDFHKYKEAFAYTFFPSHTSIYRPTVAPKAHTQLLIVTQLNITLHILHSHKFRPRFYCQKYRKVLHRHKVRNY